jgi:hypothetical protein
MDLDMNPCRRARIDQTPQQAGGQKAVVQALVGRQHLRILGFLRRVAEGLEPFRRGPQEHFEVEEIQVFQRHQHYQSDAENFHGLPLAGNRPRSSIGQPTAPGKRRGGNEAV